MLYSIKLKLTIWVLFIFSIIFTTLGFFLHYELSEIVIGSIDTHLHNEVQFIAGFLRVEDENIEVELSGVEVGEYAIPLSGHYYQIVLSDGRIIAKSPSLSIAGASLPVIKSDSVPSYQTIMGPEKKPLRLMAQSFKLSTDTVTIQAAESLENSYRILRSFGNIMLIIFPSIFILTGIGIFVITGWSLRAINTFSRKIEQITEMNLNERIEDKGMDRELQSLTVSFNTMMRRLEKSFSKQSRFLSDASHELKTPTSVIKSYCDVTLGRERTPAEYQETIRIIEKMANEMSDIINRILEVSRLEDKTFSLKFSNVDLMDIMKNVMRMLEPFASSRGIKINLSCQKININGDRERLIEVFTNILDNAIKYNKSNGRVDIEAGSREGWAVISVADTGIGISEAERERIFDRFYRVDASRSVVAGSGLGLSIVRAIVNAHDGRVEVESKIGEGSRFQVFLPLLPVRTKA